MMQTRHEEAEEADDQDHQAGQGRHRNVVRRRSRSTVPSGVVLADARTKVDQDAKREEGGHGMWTQAGGAEVMPRPTG